MPRTVFSSMACATIEPENVHMALPLSANIVLDNNTMTDCSRTHCTCRHAALAVECNRPQTHRKCVRAKACQNDRIGNKCQTIDRIRVFNKLCGPCAIVALEIDWLFNLGRNTHRTHALGCLRAFSNSRIQRHSY